MIAASRPGTLIPASMLALAILAFAIPIFAYRDVPGDVPPVTIRQLKVEARHMTKLPIVFQQVTAATAIGTPPANSAEGTVVWRTLFGIPVAEIHITRTKAVTRDGGMGAALFVPMAFLAMEASLAWLLLRRSI